MSSLSELILEHRLWNPYDFANPVDDQSTFAGRAGELKDIRYYLHHAQRAKRPINLMLAGPRSAGKTSMLNWIGDEAKSLGFTVARIDLNESDADPFALFFKVYDAVLHSAVSEGAFAGLNGPVYAAYRRAVDTDDSGTANGELLFPSHYATARDAKRALSEPIIKADLARIRRELGRTTVLLFDECDTLAKSRVELQMLRNVFMNTSGFMLVFAGTPELFPMMDDVFSPIARQFKKIPVEPFSNPDDTEACIGKPLRQIGVEPRAVLKPYPSRLVGEVHRLSAGRPYEIQLLCHYMFKRVQDGDARDMAITLDVLDDVRTELEKQDSGAGRASILTLRRLRRDDFVLLQALTEFRGTVEQLAKRSVLFGPMSFTAERLEDAYASFAAAGLLTRDAEGTIAFSGDQFDEIYARYVAAAEQVPLFIWNGGFAGDLRSALGAVLRDVECVQPIYITGGITADSKRRIQDALERLLNVAGQAPGSLPDATTEIYAGVIRGFSAGSVIVAAVRLRVSEIEIEQWVLIEGSEEALLRDSKLVRLNSRVQELGDAELLVESFTVELPSFEDFHSHICRVASPNQARLFALDHSNLGYKKYVEGDLEGALQHFDAALELRVSPSHGSAVAHLRLLRREWDEAERAAVEGRDALNGIDEDDELQWEGYAFCTYDLAVSRYMSGDLDSARVLLEEALVVATEWSVMTGFTVVPDGVGSFVIEEDMLLDAIEAFATVLGVR